MPLSLTQQPLVFNEQKPPKARRQGPLVFLEGEFVENKLEANTERVVCYLPEGLRPAMEELRFNAMIRVKGGQKGVKYEQGMLVVRRARM